MSHLDKRNRKQCNEVLEYYKENLSSVKTFLESLQVVINNDPVLQTLLHSMKTRIKDPSHLKDKLLRKHFDSQTGELTVTTENLFDKIRDLAGIRLIHMHTQQFKRIHERLLHLFAIENIVQIEQPTANCWDQEYERIYKDAGVATSSRDSMYSTVHYIVGANHRSKVCCEIQVRTLMDEVWGEVSHKVNYPKASKNKICEEQLKVLARFTTGCARLVDSIFQADGRVV